MGTMALIVYDMNGEGYGQLVGEGMVMTGLN